MHTIIEAHSPEKPVVYDPKVLQIEEENPDNGIVQEKISQFFEPEEKLVEFANLSFLEIQEKLKELNRKGKPFAFLSVKQLYLIDSRGNVLSLADSSSHYDLPVISGDSLKINFTTMTIRGKEFNEAIKLLKLLKKNNGLIYTYVSEVQIHDTIGLILYTNYAKGLPVIFGKGDLERKVAYLNAYHNEFGDSELSYKTKYLDIRIEGQIILKERV
ncbi:cell division protein FtsQ/DivIB [candidate division KSB1 bacterium]|nr:cell division protein FtsQ/DivIB [candidate division KSB1 bacterium]